jgi:GWxTD domain-containing protein
VRHHRRLRVRVCALALGALAAAAGLRSARAEHVDDAEELFRRAEAYETRGSMEYRRLAMECLERATMLAPQRAEYQLALGRLYYRMGFLKQARQRFKKVEKLDPQSADARLGLGHVWRRDWLKYLDRTSLARAVESYSLAARFRPRAVDAWLGLVPMLYEQQELEGAAAAADRALDIEPGRPEAMLAVAYTSYRLGRIGRAESTFVASIPRLPAPARQRFEDIAPVASMEDTATLRRLPPSARAEFVRRFWLEHDPDLTSRENEAQLEYWARVAHAYFLYFDPRRREWDERGEVYVRYGPPEHADYNPVGGPSSSPFSTGTFYPNTLVWSYPALGMQVLMQDRLLSEYYLLPMDVDRDNDPRPDPVVLARRGDVLSSRLGRGVFPLLPPGARPRPVSGVLARFRGEHDARVFGQAITKGAPGDTVWAEWVVLDSGMVEVARASREAGVSACSPGSERTADFAADLPPGRYQVGITLRDAAGRRGVLRAPVELKAAAGTLTLSDAVVTCGRPEVSAAAPGSAPAVHIDASPGGEVSGDGPLTVYLEMYDLKPDPRGQSRFEYECTVRSAEKDPRFWIQRLLQPRPRIPQISASRRDEQPGSLRRQFVSIPIADLAAGRYRLDVKVRDLNAESEAITSVDFVKRARTVPGS